MASRWKSTRRLTLFSLSTSSAGGRAGRGTGASLRVAEFSKQSRCPPARAEGHLKLKEQTNGSYFVRFFSLDAAGGDHQLGPAQHVALDEHSGARRGVYSVRPFHLFLRRHD